VAYPFRLAELDRLMADRTSFVIAHRLSTDSRAPAGRIVEHGRHDELLANEDSTRGADSWMRRMQDVSERMR
jgi:ABC-type transport system involved in Fe-S cluster assembly fused permease/ATPase subunit